MPDLKVLIRLLQFYLSLNKVWKCLHTDFIQAFEYTYLTHKSITSNSYLNIFRLTKWYKNCTVQQIVL